MTAHPLRWQSPSPLWSRFGEALDQARPSILRFASDDFMDQMLGTLARDPMGISDLLARPESWRTQARPTADLVERVPVPRRVQATLLGRALGRPKSAVAAVKATASVTEKAQTISLPLKLYQPAHQRYYLVSASLVCGIAGMPDRAVAAGGVEEIGFVLRRLLPPGNNSTEPREFAFVKEAESARWRRVGDDDAQLAPGEEILPLFPLACRDEGQRPRTLWSGLIPVARREEYVGAAIDRNPVAFAQGQLQSLRPQQPAAPPNSRSARMMQFKFDVAEPWKNLVLAAYTARDELKESAAEGQSAIDRRRRVFDLNLQWQMQSWLILLDFADYLAAHLPDVWTAIETGAGGASLPTPKRDLFDRLGEASMSFALKQAMNNGAGEIKPPAASLREALRSVRAASVRSGLEKTELLYAASNAGLADWPAFHFLLAGINSAFDPDGPFTAFSVLPAAGADTDPEPGPPSTLSPGQAAAERLDRLTAAVVRALDIAPEADLPPSSFALQLRNTLKLTAGDPGLFVVRCVYLNRDCGPIHPPVLSAPTEKFQLANFFDSDAPARPICITLPSDTTPAGLRKHNRNTAFVVSDLLCGQMQRAKGLGLGDLVRSVLPFPLHKDLDTEGGGACKGSDGLNIGMICSLSIPIITICALILLMIIVTLLDLIFRWRPFFMMCLPVPGLGGKK